MNLLLNNVKNGELKGLPANWKLIAFKPKFNTFGKYFNVLCEHKVFVATGDNWATFLYEANPEQVNKCISTCSDGHYMNDLNKAMEAFNQLK